MANGDMFYPSAIFLLIAVKKKVDVFRVALNDLVFVGERGRVRREERRETETRREKERGRPFRTVHT